MHINTPLSPYQLIESAVATWLDAIESIQLVNDGVQVEDYPGELAGLTNDANVVLEEIVDLINGFGMNQIDAESLESFLCSFLDYESGEQAMDELMGELINDGYIR